MCRRRRTATSARALRRVRAVFSAGWRPLEVVDEAFFALGHHFLDHARDDPGLGIAVGDPVAHRGEYPRQRLVLVGDFHPRVGGTRCDRVKTAPPPPRYPPNGKPAPRRKDERAA